MRHRIDLSRINISGIVMLMIFGGFIAAAIIHPPSKYRVPKMTAADRRVTAVHESGHALLAANLPAAGDILEMTIVSRWGILGSVTRAPADKDMSNADRNARKMAELVIAQGGQIAEELILGTHSQSTIQTSDIKAAEQIAFDLLGGPEADLLPSEAEAGVHRLMAAAEQRAREILSSRPTQINALADNLMQHDTLSGAEIAIILNGGTLDRQQENTR
jgi:cell division protease FtsH